MKIGKKSNKLLFSKMKLYTDESQTAKLIELGFETPKYECLDTTLRGVEKWNNIQCNYSIGELIKMLESVNETVYCRFGGVKANLVSTNSGYEKIGGELIDLLFDLCVKLKEEGVI